MALRSLGSVVRGTMNARTCCFSSRISEQWGAAAHNNFLAASASAAAQRNAVDGRPVAAALVSAFAASRGGLHTRGPLGSGARRFHVLRDAVAERAHAAFSALSVAVFTVSFGILYTMQETGDISDEALKEDTPIMLRSQQLMEEMKRERASYNKTVPDDKDVVQEYMEADQAMRARFEEWMKEHGRIYKDEVEKTRRFKIFDSVARFVDASNAAAAEAGRSIRFGLNEYSDWNKEELAKMCGIPVRRDGGYLKMVLSYLAAQEIWHQVPSACQEWREH
ncbi:unnamed protein product [Urochloa humidicola]